MTHEIDPQNPAQYSVVSFTDTDIPVPLEQGSAAGSESQSPPLLSVHQLMKQTRSPRERQAALVELHYRFALPVASLVLALVGISLGLSTRKGGKAVGLILTILLVFLYYIIMVFGLSFAKQGRLPPVIGLWLANVIFAVAGVLMLAQLRSVRSRLQFLQEWMDDLERRWQARQVRKRHGRFSEPPLKPRAPGSRIFQILDVYIIQGWVFYFFILLVTFTGIYIIFDFFQLLGDMVRNHASAGVVLELLPLSSPPSYLLDAAAQHPCRHTGQLRPAHQIQPDYRHQSRGCEPLQDFRSRAAGGHCSEHRYVFPFR